MNETFKRLKLARTLEILSEKGPDAFYNGELSNAIVNENNLNGKSPRLSIYTNLYQFKSKLLN